MGRLIEMPKAAGEGVFIQEHIFHIFVTLGVLVNRSASITVFKSSRLTECVNF